MSGSCGLWAVGRPGGILLDAGAAKPARDWGNGTTPTIKARRRTRSWEGIQQAGTRAGGEREGAFQQMVRIGASGSRRGGSARPRARRGAAWAQPGERRKKRTEACLGSSCSARSRAGRGGTRRPGCVSCECGRRAGQVSARRTRGGPHRVRGPRRRRAVPRMHRPEPGGRSCYDVRTRGPQAGVRVGPVRGSFGAGSLVERV